MYYNTIPCNMNTTYPHREQLEALQPDAAAMLREETNDEVWHYFDYPPAYFFCTHMHALPSCRYTTDVINAYCM